MVKISCKFCTQRALNQGYWLESKHDGSQVILLANSWYTGNNCGNRGTCYAQFLVGTVLCCVC